MQALIQKGGKAQNFDPVPEITRKHFEEALKSARKSVTNMDLEKFQQFRRKFDPSFAKTSSPSSSQQQSQGPSIKWPGSTNVQQRKQGDDDDLYN